MMSLSIRAKSSLEIHIAKRRFVGYTQQDHVNKAWDTLGETSELRVLPRCFG